MLTGFLRWLISEYLFTLLVFFGMLFVGLAAGFMSEYVVDYFELEKDSGLYLKLAMFVAILLPVLWAYDKYREWRFFNDE
jgi:hypothetical protein